MKRKQLIKYLENNNFQFIRQNKHAVYSNGTITVAIPNSLELKKGVIWQICRTLNIQINDLYKS